MSELFRALAALAEPPTGETARLAGALDLGPPPSADEYTRLFVFQLYPYASVYLGPEGMLGGEARDRVAGFWRALGQPPPAEADHLAVMLALYARISEFEEGEAEESRRDGWRRARRAFFWEHLLSWLPFYLLKLSDLCEPRPASGPSPERRDADDARGRGDEAASFYQRWAELLGRALREEATRVGPQETLSAHLRAAPPVADPRVHGADEFLQTLLAPARSGLILTRADLARAARRLDLPARAGERKFILKSLLSQDPAALLGWLKHEADHAAERHRREHVWLGPVARAWEQKARAASTLLHSVSVADVDA
ncbi:MAG TPA: molecular chaperone TorD family protein [Pyrinomonadaceae bacterium]|nr:molecular chaperone TorD family protein [Pyrinomonadaceae bacterium]